MTAEYKKWRIFYKHQHTGAQIWPLVFPTRMSRIFGITKNQGCGYGIRMDPHWSPESGSRREKSKNNRISSRNLVKKIHFIKKLSYWLWRRKQNTLLLNSLASQDIKLCLFFLSAHNRSKVIRCTLYFTMFVNNKLLTEITANTILHLGRWMSQKLLYCIIIIESEMKIKWRSKRI